MYRSGRHFLQLPGPSNVPDRVLRAMHHETIDHRGPDFPALAREVLDGLRPVFGTTGDVFVYPASGTGGWEAAIVNTLSPGERVAVFVRGFFAQGWARVAERFGLQVAPVAGDWHVAAGYDDVRAVLDADPDRTIRAVFIVHNETSTGVTADIASVRRALDDAGHDALLMVDAVSSIASLPYEHDAWGVDVTVAGGQKGLMLPPGLGFNAVSAKAMARADSSTMPRFYWDWKAMREFNAKGFFPYTPATIQLFGLREAIRMLMEEGLPAVFARHERLAEGARRAVAAWGLQNFSHRRSEHSHSVTAVEVPADRDAEELRRLILERFDMSLGAGLGDRLRGRVFRIGHLGYFNDLMLMGTLSGIEMGLRGWGLDARGGVEAAMAWLAEAA